MIEKYDVPPPETKRERAEREVDCAHEYALRIRTLTNGTVVYLNQCTVCGTTGQFLKHESLSPAAKQGATAFDPSLQATYWAGSLERKRLEREAKQGTHETDWWAWYNDYLRSAAWKKRKRLVMEREGGLCECCRINRAGNAHHLTYMHVGAEPLWDLVAVCPECHDFLHEGVMSW